MLIYICICLRRSGAGREGGDARDDAFILEAAELLFRIIISGYSPPCAKFAKEYS